MSGCECKPDRAQPSIRGRLFVMAIEISDNALNEVRRMMDKEKVNAAGMRVGVKGGGCSGLSYNLAFENQARTGDKIFAREDVKLFCDLKSYIYLNGTVL